MLKLSDLKLNEKGRIILVAQSSLKRRLNDLGFIEDEEVECILVSPDGGFKAYKICESVIALRSEDGQKIMIERI